MLAKGERCFACNQEIGNSTTCDACDVILRNTNTDKDGTAMPPLKWEGETACPGCGVGLIGFHHPYCPEEICPFCHGRLVSCGHLDDGIEDD